MINGAEWFAKLGPEKNGGPKLYCISGHVKKPGVYEASMNTTIKELIFDRAGGIREGHQLKAVIPGGSSVPILLPDQLDIPASFDSVQKAGSMLGSAGKTLCAFGDAEATPPLTTLKHFRGEYEAHIREGRCTVPADWRAKGVAEVAH